MTRKMRTDGFSVVTVVIAVFILAAIGLTGWHLSQHKDSKTQVSHSTSTSKKNTAPKPIDTYAGWKTYCDSENAKGCYMYPSDWVTSQYGGFENSTQTAYVDFSGYNNKDQAADTVYIAQVADVTDKQLGLKIVGSVYNNVPSYSIFNATDVSALKAGESAQLITTNPQFQRNSGENMSFTATPGVNGLKAITNLDQAKAWFSTPEAQTCLKVLQSFYYQ